MWLAGGLVLARMLGFLQVLSPVKRKDGAHVTLGSDACFGGHEEAGCEQTAYPLPRGPPRDRVKWAAPVAQLYLSWQVTTQSSPTALPSTATRPSPARWLPSSTPSWPAAGGEAGLPRGSS